MSNLIILVLVLLLSAAVIAMTAYYLSSSYSESELSARAAALVSEGQQISAAAQMFDADNPKGTINSLDDLMPNYLTSTPKSWKLGSSEDSSVSLPKHFMRPVPQDSKSQEICLAANQKVGLNSVPSCTNLPSDFLGCCAIEAEAP